jgi:hypothetical protein
MSIPPGFLVFLKDYPPEDKSRGQNKQEKNRMKFFLKKDLI